MMYADHGARCAWATAPTIRTRQEAVRQFYNLMVDDGERFFFPALLLAGLGYGHSGLRPRCRLESFRGFLAPRGRLAADERSPAQGRLGGEAARIPSRAAGTSNLHNEFYPDIDDTAMVMLALELMRGTDPAAQDAATIARSTGCWPCSRGRRLGGIRRGQQLGIPEQRAVRRSQCHARSDLPGYHGPRARGSLPLRIHGDHPRVRRGVEYLSVRRSATAAGTAGGASTISTGPVLR